MADLVLSNLQDFPVQLLNGISSVTETLTAVDLSKTMDFSAYSATSSDAGDYMLEMFFPTTTQFRHQRSNLLNTIIGHTFVAEFSSGMFCQHIESFMNGASSQDLILPFAVDPTKSWASVNYRALNSNLNNQALVRAKIINGGTHVRIERKLSGNDPTVAVTVCEVDNANVITKETTQTGTGISTSLGTTLDPERTFIIASWMQNGTSTADKLPAISLNSSGASIDTQYYSSVTSIAPEVVYHAIEIPEIFVERDTLLFTNGQANASIIPTTAYDLTETIIKINNPLGFGSVNTTSADSSNFMFDAAFQDADEAGVGRLGTLNTARIPYEIIRFNADPPSEGILRKTAVMAGVNRGIYKGVM